MFAKVKAVPAFLLSIPNILMYSKGNEELRQCCNFASEVSKNREAMVNKNLLPYK